MATTNITLYPPVLTTILPAQTVDSTYIKIPFNLSAFNSADRDKITRVHVSLKERESFVSSLGYYTDDTRETFNKVDALVIEFNTNLKDDETGLYYINIPEENIFELSKKQDKYYQVQMRFDTTTSIDLPTDYANTVAYIYNSDLLDNFSEWSKVSLLKFIKEPKITLVGFSSGISSPSSISSCPIYTRGEITLNGKLEIANGTSAETTNEQFESCYVSVVNSNGTQIWPQTDTKESVEISGNGQSFNYNFTLANIDSSILLDATPYYIYLNAYTNNHYHIKNTYYKFMVKEEDGSSYIEKCELSKTVDQEETGRVSLTVTYDVDCVGYFYVRRASSITNFRTWEILKVFTHNDGIGDESKVYTFEDTTVNPFVWYKYSCQYQNIKGYAYSPVDFYFYDYDSFISGEITFNNTLEYNNKNINFIFKGFFELSDTEKSGDSLKFNFYKNEKNIIGLDLSYIENEKTITKTVYSNSWMTTGGAVLTDKKINIESINSVNECSLSDILDFLELNSNYVREQKTTNLCCIDFDIPILSDKDRQLQIFDWQVSNFKPTRTRTVINTLGGKYPKFAENGDMNYRTYSVSGTISSQADEQELFMTKTTALNSDVYDNYYNYSGYNHHYDDEEEYGTYERTERNKIYNSPYYGGDLRNSDYMWEREFRDAAIEWLDNGEPKLYRAYTDLPKIIMFTDISLSPKQGTSDRIFSFSGTMYEIEDGDSLDNLDSYNLFNVQEADETSIFSNHIDEYVQLYLYKVGNLYDYIVGSKDNYPIITKKILGVDSNIIVSNEYINNSKYWPKEKGGIFDYLKSGYLIQNHLDKNISSIDNLYITNLNIIKDYNTGLKAGYSYEIENGKYVYNILEINNDKKILGDIIDLYIDNFYSGEEKKITLEFVAHYDIITSGSQEEKESSTFNGYTIGQTTAANTNILNTIKKAEESITYDDDGNIESKSFIENLNNIYAYNNNTSTDITITVVYNNNSSYTESVILKNSGIKFPNSIEYKDMKITSLNSDIASSDLLVNYIAQQYKYNY